MFAAQGNTKVVRGLRSGYPGVGLGLISLNVLTDTTVDSLFLSI